MLGRGIGLLAAFLLVSAATPTFAADEAGTVLALTGESFLAAGGQRAPLKIGDTVHVGDQLEVTDNAKVRLQMTDGSVVTAAAGTTLKIEAFVANGSENRTAKFSLLSGLLRAVVSKMSKPSQFEVDTATGVAAVRSTDWFIRTDTGSTQVGVLKGVVSLASRATDRSVDIPARWGARVEAGKDPVPPRVWQKSEFADVINRTNLP